MSRRVADIATRRATMFQDCRSLSPDARKPTRDEKIVFRHFGLSAKVREVAIYAARRSYPQARDIYAAIARSLVKR